MSKSKSKYAKFISLLFKCCGGYTLWCSKRSWGLSGIWWPEMYPESSTCKHMCCSSTNLHPWPWKLFEVGKLITSSSALGTINNVLNQAKINLVLSKHINPSSLKKLFSKQIQLDPQHHSPEHPEASFKLVKHEQKLYEILLAEYEQHQVQDDWSSTNTCWKNQQ